MEKKELVELSQKISDKRTIPFFGSLDSPLYTLVRDKLLSMAADSIEPITILFDSNGGDTFFSFQLGDLIRLLSSCEVIGVVLEANSAACTVLQYCTTRLIVPSGRLFVHSNQPTEKGVAGIRYNEHWQERIKCMGEMIEEGNARLRQLFSERSGLPGGRIRKLMERGDNLLHQINAIEALELNLVDAIVPPDYRLYFSLKRENE